MIKIIRENTIQEKNNSAIITDKLELTLDQAIELKSYHKKYDLALANMLQKDFMNDDSGGLTFSEWYTRNISKYKPKIQGLVDWLTGRNERPNPSEPDSLNVKDISFTQALQYSKDWHEHIAKVSYTVSRDADVRQEQENALIVFQDGSYWIDLETSNDSDEAEAMGHCGNTSADTLISYRDNEGNPHLTMAFNYSDRSYQQLKGKGNSKPSPKYHDVIYRIFKELDINSYRSKYDPEDDFIVTDLPEKQAEELTNKHPDLLPALMQMIKILDGDIKGYLSDFDSDLFNINGLIEIHENSITVQFNESDFDNSFDRTLLTEGVLEYLKDYHNITDTDLYYDFFIGFLDTPEVKKLHNRLYTYFLENYNNDEEFAEFENMQDVIRNSTYGNDDFSREAVSLVRRFYIKYNSYFVEKIIMQFLEHDNYVVGDVQSVEVDKGMGGVSIICGLNPARVYDLIVSNHQNGDDKVIIESYDLEFGSLDDGAIFDNPELFAEFLKGELKL